MIILPSSKPDVIFITGDAYVDHPSFGIAVLTRYLQHHGFSVGIIAQPDHTSSDIIKKIGPPRLFYGVTAGNLDSMVSNYTALKHPRKKDEFSEGGVPGKRPNRATIVYCNLIRSIDRETPVVIGGIEASLRRIAHYDYWQEKLRSSILEDCNADMLVYGMAERTVLQIAQQRASGKKITDINIPSTAFLCSTPPENAVIIPSLADMQKNSALFLESTLLYDKHHQKNIIAQRQAKKWVVLNPPITPMNQSEIDLVYSLPYSRQQYADYKKDIPALKTVENSVITHRGCYGGCSFCSLYLHQGRAIQSRSIESVCAEIQQIQKQYSFRGTITDIGGPTANMYGSFCSQGFPAECKRHCLWPDMCPNLVIPEKTLMRILKAAAEIPGVKHLFIGSGLRYDMLLKTPEYFKRILQSHISGQMKIAPEHVSDSVCALMKKPDGRLFEQFLKQFQKIRSDKLYLIPYYICAHPGCTLQDMNYLKRFNKKYHLVSHQVQIFTPTPMSHSTCMYYTGTDMSGNQITIARNLSDKKNQKSVLIP